MEVKFRCLECGDDLKFEMDANDNFRGQYLTFRILPCEKCIESEAVKLNQYRNEDENV